MNRDRTLMDLTALAALFAHRVARVRDLISLGLSGESIRARCAPGGRWQRLFPGVVLLDDAPPSRAALIQAVLTHAGPTAVLTGPDALRLHGLRTARPGGPVHVLVPRRRQVTPVDAVTVERTSRLPTPVLLGGFGTAPVDRAVLDTARRAGSVAEVRMLLTEAVRRGRVSARTLGAELASGNARGSAMVRRVLDELNTGERSLAERWGRHLVRRLVQRGGVPWPAWRVPLAGPDGTDLGVVDAWWDDVGLAWKIDSAAWHTTVDRYATALRHGCHLSTTGATVVHTNPARLTAEPGLVIDELARAYEYAGNRPRPPVCRRITASGTGQQPASWAPRNPSNLSKETRC